MLATYQKIMRCRHDGNDDHHWQLNIGERAESLAYYSPASDRSKLVCKYDLVSGRAHEQCAVLVTQLVEAC